MECVAEEVKMCIQELMYFRDVPQEKWVISDNKGVQAL
jgi:hypothetical protein